MPVDGDIILKAGLDTAGVTKSIGELSKSISKGLKNTIRLAFGVRSVFALIRKMRTALFSGFEDLAQVHEPFNQAMSEIMSSLKTLRNTFASAFAPIVETVAPILTTFINLVAKAVSTIGQFIAALTGKEYVSAGQVQVDYANSVGQSTKNTKSATNATKQQTKAQKELNREITRFDDLVILHEKDNNDTDTTPTGTSTPASTFSTVPVDSAISQFAKDFLAAWEKMDLTELGTKVGTALKNALESIPWPEIKEKLQGIATRLATFLNGFLETPDLYYTIGETIAELINSAVLFSKTFFEEFHWDSWGTAIRDKLVGILENVDWGQIYDTMELLGSGIGTALNAAFDDPYIWDLIFTTITSGFNALVIAVESFLDSVSWIGVGSSISTGLYNGLLNINWDHVFSAANSFGVDLAQFLNGLFKPDTFSMIGTTVANLLNAALVVLNRFGSTFDFTNFGTSLAAGINGFLLTFDTNRLSAGVNKLVRGLRDSILAFISNVSWYNVGVKLREILVGIDWKEILYSFGRVIWAAINASVLALKGLFDADNVSGPISDALTKLQSVISEAAENIDFDSIEDGFSRIVTALTPAAEGFAVGFLEVFQGLAEVGVEVLNGIGEAFGIIADALEDFDPPVITAIGIALGVLVGAVVAFKGAEVVAGIVSSLVQPFADFIGTLVAHPLLGIAAGLTALSLAMASLVDKGFFSDADTQIAIQNANEVIKSAQEVRREINDTIDAIQGKDRDIDATYAVLRNLANEYFNLKQKVYLTKEEQKRLQELENTLSNELPGFQSIISDTTSTYSDQQSAVNDLITSTEEYYKTLAAEEFLKDYYTKLFELEVEIQKNRDAHDELVEAYDNTIDRSNILGGILGEFYDALDGTQGKLSDLDAEYMNLVGQQDELNAEYEAQKKVLEGYNTAVDDTTKGVSDLVDANTKVKKSTSEVKKGTGEAKTSTSDFAKIFDLFKNVSITTPLKLALISAAIKSLSDANKISKEDTDKLYKALDEYDPSKPEESMDKVAKAFENTGISSTEFVVALNENYKNADKDTKEAMDKISKQIVDLGPTLKTDMTASAKNIPAGLVDGVKDGAKDVEGAMKALGEDSTIGSFETALDMKSPSKEMELRGKYIDEGLVNGIKDNASNVVDQMDQVASDTLATLDDYKDEFSTAGSDIASSVGSGLSDNSYLITDSAGAIASDISTQFTDQDYYTLGYNIGDGIYEGLIANNYRLQLLAWNTAVDMYNSACRALGIASPSKKFAWIGEMVTEGLQDGIIDNQDNAIDAVADLTTAMTQEAEKTNPAVAITTAIDDWIVDLDAVLTKFADIVSNRFDNLINMLAIVANLPYQLPAIAQGKIAIPATAGTTSSTYDNALMQQTLDNLANNQLNVDDVRTVLTQVLRENADLWSLYLGDEQIARHANAGNVSLNRRYSV